MPWVFFFPSLTRNRQCFPFQLPLTVAERVSVGSEFGLLLVGRMAGPNITASMDVGRHCGRK